MNLPNALKWQINRLWSMRHCNEEMFKTELESAFIIAMNEGAEKHKQNGDKRNDAS
jgi:hypothetical protein